MIWSAVDERGPSGLASEVPVLLRLYTITRKERSKSPNSMIAIIDYGMGNLRSVQKAIEAVGHVGGDHVGPGADPAGRRR